MTRDEQINLGKVFSLLREDKRFMEMYEAYTDTYMKEQTESFDDSIDKREALMAIAHFKNWFNQIIDNAIILQQEKSKG
jgi:hypothetical protein